MDQKVQKKYVDDGLGFPVVILNAPMIKVRGQWVLHVNYNDYQQAILQLLAHKPSKLTANEVRFVRTYFQMTVRAFAERFAVKHTAVLKWESKGDLSTHMNWSTEKDIRMFILDELKKKASDVLALYRSLKETVEESVEPVVLDSDDMAA